MASKSADYGFVRKPKWIISHLVVLALLVGLCILGLWQISRLYERQDRNDLVRQRTEFVAEPVEALVAGATNVDDLEWRLAEATGEYQIGDQILVVNRSFEGAAGAWVITPLLLSDGSAVIVNRGWVPFSVQATEDRSSFDPPSGAVTIGGLVQLSQVRGRFGAGDPVDADLLARVDLDAYSDVVDYPLLPVYVQLESATGGVDGGPNVPILVRRPVLTNGPHLSYSVQWFIFAAIAAGGYGLILRTRAWAKQ